MGRLLAVLVGVAGAVLSSQGPGFTLQYLQNLQGRIDELKPIVADYDARVTEAGSDRDTAVAECEDTDSPVMLAMCGGYPRAVERLSYLTNHLAALEGVSDMVRPLILARSFDKDIAKSVKSQFEPAVPANLEGAVYGAGGFGVGWGASVALFGLLGSMFGGRR